MVVILEIVVTWRKMNVSRNIFHWEGGNVTCPRAGRAVMWQSPTHWSGPDHPPFNQIPTSKQFRCRQVNHDGVTPLMLMLGSVIARKLVLWPYSSCVVCRDVWRRKPTMEDDERVIDTNWFYLARLVMFHCLSPTSTIFFRKEN